MMEMWHAVTKWKSSDGRILDVRDMTDRHLINAVRYIKRKSIEKARGDGVRWDYFTPPIFDLMLSELKRRGLEYDPYNDMYEKVMAHKIHRRALSEARRRIKKYADELTKTREIDLGE
jgi:hypothetical protein